MKAKIFLASMLLFAVTSVHADVIIYKMVESNLTIGYDLSKSGTAGGYLVNDWDTGEVRILRARVVNGSKQFTVTIAQDALLYIAQGPRNSTYTIFSRYLEKSAPKTEYMDVLYGVDKEVALRPGYYVWAPRTLKGTPRQIIVGEDIFDVQLTKSTTTCTFLSKDTQSANIAAQTMDAVMDRYRAMYLAKGYYEVPDPQ